MQQGGFNIKPIKDSDFRYTQSADRKIWVKNVFPIAEYLISAILKIPWSTYQFEGTSAFWKKTTTGTFVREDLDIVASLPATPRFYFFGGSVYEIMNILYSKDTNIPELHDFVDPTGDLDVLGLHPLVTLPPNKSLSSYVPYFFEKLPVKGAVLKALVKREKIRQGLNASTAGMLSNEGMREAMAIDIEPPEIVGCEGVPTNTASSALFTVRDSRRYTRYLEHYTDWIMDSFAANLNQYKKGTLFDSLFGNTVPFNLENDVEGRYADRIICVGNLKIVRSYLYYMGCIKIQLIAKFKDMQISDHVCEILIGCPSSPSDYKINLEKYLNAKQDFHVLKGVPLANFKSLVHDNLDSMVNRFSLHTGEKRHKFYNHVGRMKYLHDFFLKKLNSLGKTDATKITLSQDEYKELGKEMAYFTFYILENYFSGEIVNFSFAVRKELNRNPTYLSRWTGRETKRFSKIVVKSLIGAYPMFLLKKQGEDFISLVGDVKVSEYRAPFGRQEFDFENLFTFGDLENNINTMSNTMNIRQAMLIARRYDVLNF